MRGCEGERVGRREGGKERGWEGDGCVKVREGVKEMGV